jgi:hypothetical protein
MKRNIWIVVLLVAVAALAVVVVRQSQRIAEMKEQLASAAAIAEKARTPKAPPVPAPKRKLTEPLPEANPVEPVSVPVQVVAPAPAPDAMTQASASATSNLFAELVARMKNPQMKEAMRATQKVAINRAYGPLSKYTNLTVEQLDALKDLILERQMAMRESALSVMSGSESDRKQAAEDAKAIKAEYDKKIQDLLGPQEYQVFQDYEKVMPERMQVQSFRDTLPSDLALTEQQEYDLMSAMYEERKALPTSSLLNDQNKDPSQLTEERIAEETKMLERLQQQYTNRAVAILSPQQFQQFQQYMDQQRAMQTMAMKMAAQMFGNKPAPQPPANQAQTP